MNALLSLLRPRLYRLLQEYRSTEEQMPWAYQKANPDGRPLHDDWGIMSSNPIIKALQPWQKIKRIDCAYRVPLPFKITDGPCERKWILWNENYPVSRDTPAEYREYRTVNGVHRLPHVLADYAGYGLVTFSAFLGEEWVPCFKKYTRLVGGRRLSWYAGLHQDLHVSPPDENGVMRSDLMAWFPEVAISWIKES